MTKVLTTTISLGLALALVGPAHAQLIHGGLGGGFAGNLGGGFGRGLSGGGDFGVNGTIDATEHTTRTTTTTRSSETGPAPKGTRASARSATTTTALTPTGTVHAPALSAAPLTDTRTMAVTNIHGRVTNRPQTARAAVGQDVTHVVFVPAIPDYGARHAAIIAAGIAPIDYAQAPAYIDTQYQVLQNDLRGSGVDVVRRGQQIVLEMPGDVTFAFDKYDIQPRFRPVLDTVAQTLSKYSATYIDVDGHTDAIGSVAYNQTLSEKRAFSVANYLSERAVTPVRMHVEGFGKTEPIASNATVTGRAANRRVEIVLTPYIG
jgi:outer membrane protein OmpA-like peptidoglycan-associated protein